LQAAVLATIAMVLGHFAVLAAATRVAQLLANRALEESFATLAADGPIMTTCPYRTNIMQNQFIGPGLIQTFTTYRESFGLS